MLGGSLCRVNIDVSAAAWWFLAAAVAPALVGVYFATVCGALLLDHSGGRCTRRNKRTGLFSRCHQHRGVTRSDGLALVFAVTAVAGAWAWHQLNPGPFLDTVVSAFLS